MIDAAKTTNVPLGACCESHSNKKAEHPTDSPGFTINSGFIFARKDHWQSYVCEF